MTMEMKLEMTEMELMKCIEENGLLVFGKNVEIDSEAGEFDYDVYDEESNLLFSIYKGPEAHGVLMFQTKIKKINDEVSERAVVKSLTNAVSEFLGKPVVVVFNHRLQDEYKEVFESNKAWFKLDLRHKTLFGLYLPPCVEDYLWNSEAYTAYVNDKQIAQEVQVISKDLTDMLAEYKVLKVDDNGYIHLRNGKFLQLKRNLTEVIMCVLAEGVEFKHTKTYFIKHSQKIIQNALRKAI